MLSKLKTEFVCVRAVTNHQSVLQNVGELLLLLCVCVFQMCVCVSHLLTAHNGSNWFVLQPDKKYAC